MTVATLQRAIAAGEQRLLRTRTRNQAEYSAYVRLAARVDRLRATMQKRTTGRVGA